MSYLNEGETVGRRISRKKHRIKILGLALAMMLAINPLTTFAAEENGSGESQGGYIDVENINLADFEEVAFNEMEGATIDAVTTVQVDTSKDVIDVSSRLARRDAALLPDNPRVNITGELTSDDDLDFQFFSVTADKFMVARLLSTNANYVAQLYIVDYETGDATPTNIGNSAGNLIALNGLPAGDYAFIIYSADDTVGDSYTLQINATNPSNNVAQTLKITNDLLHFVLQYTTGDVYADGTFVYNINNMDSANTHLNWSRSEDVNWGSGYNHREHSIYNVRIKQVSGPASWSSSHANSDNVMLIYCDVNTGFTFMQSAYQSGSYHEYSFKDTFGKVTPRPLDEEDLTGFSHILAYDLNTGTVIDFYSPLNLYYASGAEAAPTVNFY